MPLVSAPTNLSETPPPSHCNRLPRLMGATQTQLVFMTLNHLIPTCLFSPIFHSALYHPYYLSPSPTSMPWHITFSHPKCRLLPSIWLLAKVQVRHVFSRKTALATPGEYAALIQITHLVISNISPYDLFILFTAIHM